jgi:UDP-N-acetylmuramate--alanine ligase
MDNTHEGGFIMYQIDFSAPVKVHFIGIGGVSMSGLAMILQQNGFAVSGSDAHLSPMTDRLAGRGIRIYEGNLASNLEDLPDVVVYTAAVHPDNPEYACALSKGIPMLTRAQLLGQIMKNYPTAIGVSGTHGKTTATSMLSHVLLDACLAPTISVGGMLPKIDGNIHVEDGEIFLTEACEYTNSFLSLHPTMELILNIEADHLDFFKDIEDIRHSFHRYMQLLPEAGVLIINSSIRDLAQLTGDLACKTIITYGLNPESSAYSCANLSTDHFGCYSFDVLAPGHPMNGRRVRLCVPGLHNVSNALAVIAASDALGIDPEVIISALFEFHGTDRRFQKKGEVNGFTIIDDYAHHPQEITATLEAAKNYPHNQLRVIFQPHTYSRTKALFDDFAAALSQADEVVLASIYPARETDTLGMDSALLAEAITKLGTPARSFETFQEIEDYVYSVCRPKDLLITMGAGDVFKVGEDLLCHQSV